MNMNCNHVTLLVLVDLSSAFDIVDHKILLVPLKSSIGINGTALNWFTSYLNNGSRESRQMALHLTLLAFVMAFHKDRLWGHCCLPFTSANSLKLSNTIYLRHLPMLMTLSFTCRLVLARLLIRLMQSLPWNAVDRTFARYAYG